MKKRQIAQQNSQVSFGELSFFIRLKATKHRNCGIINNTLLYIDEGAYLYVIIQVLIWVFQSKMLLFFEAITFTSQEDI